MSDAAARYDLLETLILDAGEDSDLFDDVLDEMDALWWEMTPDEQDARRAQRDALRAHV